jgi:hypothetical protein
MCTAIASAVLLQAHYLFGLDAPEVGSLDLFAMIVMIQLSRCCLRAQRSGSVAMHLPWLHSKPCRALSR